MRIYFKILVFAALALAAAQCGTDEKPRKKAIAPQPVETKIELVATPQFNLDSAYAFVAKQVSFGPRVPNTPGHKACAKWLETKLKSFGLEVLTQPVVVTAFNGEPLNIVNIMGRYRSDLKKRIVLAAHWDTRPFADRDTENRAKPIDGANDGASGVAVLLELARAVMEDSTGPEIGFDIVFFDAEDYGQPESTMMGNKANTWCLGSQYWAQNPMVPNYNPEYGILLDMVGAPDAVFPKEGTSMYFAPQVVNHVWNVAKEMNYGNYFVQRISPQITDDHVPMNQLAKIPTIDIIHYDLARMDFGRFHHTHDDNMEGIDKGTLKVVGEVALQVLYLEQDGDPS